MDGGTLTYMESDCAVVVTLAGRGTIIIVRIPKTTRVLLPSILRMSISSSDRFLVESLTGDLRVAQWSSVADYGVPPVAVVLLRNPDVRPVVLTTR